MPLGLEGWANVFKSVGGTGAPAMGGQAQEVQNGEKKEAKPEVKEEVKEV